MARKGFRGWIALKKTGGVSGAGFMAVGDTVYLPGTAYPNNPEPITRAASANASVNPSIEQMGKYAATIDLVAQPKTSWLFAAVINSLVLSYDTDNNSDLFTVAFYDSKVTRRYDGSRCAAIRMSGTGRGGIGPVALSFVTRFPENSGGGSIVAPSGPSAGQIFPARQIGYGGTADKVRSWAAELYRPQEHDFDASDGTDYPTDVLSGGFGGIFQLMQDPDYTLSPAGVGSNGSAILRVGTTGAGFQLAMLLGLNNDNLPLEPSVNSETKTWGFIDKSTGGNPCVVSAL